MVILIRGPLCVSQLPWPFLVTVRQSTAPWFPCQSHMHVGMGIQGPKPNQLRAPWKVCCFSPELSVTLGKL